MLLALLSDTHDNAAMTKAALARFAPYKPAAYLHAGDLVDAGMLFLFAGIGPFHFVFGNNEYDHAGIRSQALVLELNCHGAMAELTFAGKRVALLHGHDGGLLRRVMGSGDYDYVVHGHTHVRSDKREAGTRVINPGAVQRTQTKSVALLDLASDDLRFLPLTP